MSPRERYQGDLEPLARIFPIEGYDSWRSKLTTVHDNHFTDVQNLDWSRIYGAVSTSQGRSAFATVGGTVFGLGRFTACSTAGTPNRTVVVRSQQVDVVDDNGLVSANISLPITPTANVIPSFASFANKNILMWCNGSDVALKLAKNQLSSATRVGIVAPASIGTAVSDNGGTNLSGLYQWRYTYQSATHECSPSPVSNQLSLSAQQAKIPVTASTDPQVNFINLYRIGGSAPEWLFVAQFANTTATLTDNNTDASLIATNIPLGFFRDPPPTGMQGWVEHKQRIIGFNGNNLLFSNYQEPEGWNPLNSLPVGGSAPIKAIATTGSVLVIYKDLGVWGLFGETLADMVLRPMVKRGLLATYSVVNAGGAAAWLGDDLLVRMFDGTKIDTIGYEVLGKIRTLTAAQQRSAVGVWGGNRYLLSFPGAFTLAYDITISSAQELIASHMQTQQAIDFTTTRSTGQDVWDVKPWTFDKAVSAYDDNGLQQFIVTDGASSSTLRVWPGGYTDLGNPVSWFVEKDQITGMYLRNTSPYRYRIDISTIAYKKYRELEIIAPPQPGVTVKLTIQMDNDPNKIFVKMLDFGVAPFRVGLPPLMMGKLMRIRLEGTTSQVVELHGIVGWGLVERGYAQT